MELQEVSIQLSTGQELDFYHNLPMEGPNNLQDALNAWVKRTKDYSAESFCHYITEKREQGFGPYYAFSSQESYDRYVESLNDKELTEFANLFTNKL